MNELAGALSPYLLLSKNQPVHWRQWSDETLATARAEGKPILLSVGFSSCHWCHVMARECFEDGEIAAVINALYTPIKVDREERPDIDRFYMAALHAAGHAGGWPLTMFLTPEGEAFWGGSYFPREASAGQPGFLSVLKAVAEIFRDERSSIRERVASLNARLSQVSQSAQTISAESIATEARRLAFGMDPVHGGVRGTPKFPNCTLLDLLWRVGFRWGDETMRGHVLTTLRAIAKGGIHDHVGGGFARYAVDERWIVPHFEKMLGDNAQLLRLFAMAAQATGEALFADAARGIVDWLIREMRLPEGPFAAGLDADGGGDEGLFYTWTHAEIERILGAAARSFCSVYNVRPEGNFAEGRNILHNAGGTACPDREHEVARRLMLAARARRAAPRRDDKILADWNGLVIAALARAGIALERSDWVRHALASFDAIVALMGIGDGESRLAMRHVYRQGALGEVEFAADSVHMLGAALALHEALAFDEPETARRCLRQAEALLRNIEAHFLPDGEGLVSGAARGSAASPRELARASDDALPNPTSALIEHLATLAIVTEDEAYAARAEALIAAAQSQAFAAPAEHAAFFAAADFYLHRISLVVSGQDPALLLAAKTLPIGFSALGAIDPDTPSQAQLCRGTVCSVPLRDSAELIKTFASLVRLQP